MTARTLLLAAAAAGALSFSTSIPLTALAQDTAPTAPSSSMPGSDMPQSQAPSTSSMPSSSLPSDQPAPAPDASRPATSTAADSAGAPASATEDNWIGAKVYDRKGTMVGRIERVVTGTQGGAPSQIELNVRGNTVVVPAATLTLANGRATSSQSLTEIESSGPEGH